MKIETFWVVEFDNKYFHGTNHVWTQYINAADFFSSKEAAEQYAEFYQANVREVTLTIK